jgi:Flp pilus assembly protein protease CpaA
MAWRHGISLETLHGAVFGTILLGITMTDAREYIIPHEFSLGGTVLAILLSAWPDPSYTLVAFQGALVGAGAVLLIGELSELVIGQEAMGGGDCALMGMIGAFLGWEAILPVLLLGALISTLLFLITALWPHRGSSKEPRSERGVEGEPAILRWGMVARLFVIGVTPIILLALSVRVGVVGDVFSLISRALLGAGIAYYASFLLPASVAQRRWVRVRGLLAAAIAVALSAPLSGVRLALGLALGVAIVQYAKHVRPAQSPGTREELTAEGYLPFGVGLAVAAAVLDFSGALPLVRDVVLEYGRFLRLA